MNNLTFGEKIRQLREGLDLSLREVALKIDVSAAFLSDVELGRRFPSADKLTLLATMSQSRQHPMPFRLPERQTNQRKHSHYAHRTTQIFGRHQMHSVYIGFSIMINSDQENLTFYASADFSSDS